MKKYNQRKSKKTYEIKDISVLRNSIQGHLLMSMDNNLELFAKVDPETLKKVEALIENDVLAGGKDTEDYNEDLVSTVVDGYTSLLKEAGARKINPGDYIKLREKVLGKTEGIDTFKDFLKAVETGDYEKYPFSQGISEEIRSIFLLQTESSDRFKNLMEEFDKYSFKFFKNKEDLKVFKKAMKASEERIFKNPILFPAPSEGRNQGLLRSTTPEENAIYGLDESMSVDERFDNHDLLALKDLVLMMRSEEVHSLALGPSFFGKYLPELKKEGYEGVIVVVENDKLKEIKLTKLPSTRTIAYGPVNAAAQLFFNYLTSFKEVVGDVRSINKKNYAIAEKPKDLGDKERVFVIVDGCVAIPSKNKSYGNEKMVANDKRLDAAEIFEFEKIEGEVVQTRLSFVPYDYTDLHIFYQLGSTIYGANDQSFQSCYKEEKDFAEEKINDYKDYWAELTKKGKSQGDAFSPALTASRLNNFPKNDKGEISEPTDIFKEENRRNLMLVLHSISEQTDFTRIWTLRNLHYYHMIYTGDVNKKIQELTKYEAPFNRRWLASSYMIDGKGLTKEKQQTFFTKLSKDLENSKIGNSVKEVFKIKELIKHIDNGSSLEEAVGKVYKD